MGSTTYGWLTINDNGDTHENGQVTIGSVQTHTGRSVRSKSFTLTTDGGADSELIVEQSAAGVILAIDGWEDSSHNEVSTIGDAGGLYYMVGHANVDSLEASETPDSNNNNSVCTDLNSQAGEARTNGFALIEAGGTAHTGVMFEASIPYGTDAQYTFKIPVVFDKADDRREVQFYISDGTNTASGSVIQG